MVDPVYVVFGLMVAAYVGQAVILGGQNLRQIGRRLYKNTNLAFLILTVGSVSALYIMQTSPKEYFLLPTILGTIIGITLGRKIENVFQIR